MQEHHRKLIEEQAEAWKQDGHLHGTTREVSMYDTGPAGFFVGLEERGQFNRRITQVMFNHDEMPLTAQMVRDRFANPFGGK